MSDPRAAFVSSKFSAWRMARTQMEARWLSYYRTYRCLPDAQDKSRQSERSQLKMPNSKEAVTNFVFSASSILFSSDPWFDLAPSPANEPVKDPMQSAMGGLPPMPPGMPMPMGGMSDPMMMGGPGGGMSGTMPPMGNPMPGPMGMMPQPMPPVQSSVKDRAYLMRSYLRYLFADEKYEEKARISLTEMGVYGTAINRIRPVKKTHSSLKRTITPKPTYNPLSGQLEMTMDEQVQREEVDYVYPRTEPVSIFNFYVNPTADDIDSAEGVIIRHWLTRAQLERMKEEGVIDKLPITTQTNPGPTLDTTDNLYRRLSYLGVTPSTDTDRFEVLEWMGYVPPSVLNDRVRGPEDAQPFSGNTEDSMRVYDSGGPMDASTMGTPALADGATAPMSGNPVTPDSDFGSKKNPEPFGGKEQVYYVCNGEVLNNDTDPPFWCPGRPFVVSRFEKIPGEFYGMGIIEVSEGPQKALDATIRARIDNLAISLNTNFAVNMRKLTPGQNFNNYPGKIWLVEGDPREAMTPFITPDVTQSTYPAAAEYAQAIQAAHGVKPVVGGRSDKQGQQTATEVSSLMANAMGLIKEIAKSFENNVIEPTIKWYTAILFQFPNPEEAFYVLGPTGPSLVTIAPEDITANWKVIPMGVIQMEQRNNVAKLMNFLSATANPLDAPFVNRPALLKEAYKGLGFANADEVIFQPPLHPMAQAALQANLMSAGGGGAPSQPAPESEQPGGRLEQPTAPGGTPTPIQ